ncbi:uncharacterized protein BXIN_1891 [Babesia sp. Xinjiang]|uniref:uncharacterized protein n=1 Tax=Babesia sp. Xinjiang TaxID=462227 RepID=UPI000A230D1D|nr:uncharacterized protein BXIN_1891 [Babesia sp. Xinjiang]ORM40319.1 hypothetical protein BXIN_1891 [Babesia sp. Xinjiang]
MVYILYIVILKLWVTFISKALGYECLTGYITTAQCLKAPRASISSFISSTHTQWMDSLVRYRTFPLYAVPKKKPSKRRTRIRKTAWMKRLPLNWKQPMMLDIFDVTKYTDGTLTKSRTTHQNWLNLPDTSLEGEHFLTREIRPRCCCSGGNVGVQSPNFDVDAHRRVLLDAGVSPDAVQSIDVGHFQILEPVTQTKIVEVTKEIIDEKIIEVPAIQYVDKIVEVDVPVVKYKPVYKKKEVVVEKHRHVPRIVYEDKIVEVPQIKYVEKEVEVPQIVMKEKIVEEPKIMIVEHVIPVLRVSKADHTTDIDNAGEEFLDDNMNGVTYVEAEGIDARADMACCTTR